MFKCLRHLVSQEEKEEVFKWLRQLVSQEKQEEVPRVGNGRSAGLGVMAKIINITTPITNAEHMHENH